MRRNVGTRLWSPPHGLAYVRCSKDEQEGSTEGQLRLIESAMEDHGLSLMAPPFIDDGRRGSDEERPALLALLDYCRTHPVRPRNTADYVPIFVQATDRLGRFLEPMKIFTYLNEFKELGYDVYSTSEKIQFIGGSIGDWIQIVVRSDQATGYSVRLSHDSLRGGLQTAEKGFLAGGSPCYGYDRVVVGSDGKPRYKYTNLPGKRIAKYSLDGILLATLEPVLRKGKLVSASLDKSNSDHVTRILGDAQKVKAVERIFEIFVENRRGFRTIADTLNREGYPPPRSRNWLSSAVRSIIINPVYMGAAIYGRRSKSKFHDFSVERPGKNHRISIDRKEIFRKGFVYRELEECVVVHEAHPAIVSREKWTRAQEILASKVDGSAPKRTGRGAGSCYLLTGLVKCARCGYTFQGDTHRRTGWRSYQCGGYANGGKSICERQIAPAERIETWISKEMGKRLLDGRAQLFDDYPDFERAIEAEVRAQFRTEKPREDRSKTLESKLTDKRKRVELILTGLAEDNLDVANETIRTLKKEIAGLESQLKCEKDGQQPRLHIDPKAVAREAARYLWNLKEVLDKGTMEERRKIVEYFVERVKVNGLEGWVEASFFESPRLPGASFCMVPPTGFEPVSRP